MHFNKKQMSRSTVAFQKSTKIKEAKNQATNLLLTENVAETRVLGQSFQFVLNAVANLVIFVW